MQVTGSYRVSATPEQVWEALFDPAVLRQCIPGCEDVQRVSPTEFTAAVVLKIGPVKANFAGKVTLSDLDRPQACRMTGEGSGGAAGFAKGTAALKIAPAGAETILNYSADAQIGGKLAQLGSRMVESTTRKLADEFFSRFANIVGGGNNTARSPDTESAEAMPANGTISRTASANRNWMLLASVLVVCLAVAIGYALLRP